MRENDSGNVPKLYRIYYGEVTSLQNYGAFIRIPGCRKQGLVHISQMANARVEDPSDLLAKGERVYCKVIAMERSGDKISLSMKVVNQSTGEDLDPNNVQSSQDEKKRRQWNFRGRNRIDLGAELNTTCRRCGGHGHFAMDCFVARGDSRYGLIPELDQLTEQAADNERSDRRYKKEDKKDKKTHQSRRTKSSSESDTSSSDDDQRKKPTRAFTSDHSGKNEKYRRHRERDSSSEKEKFGKRENPKFEKYGSGDRYREKSRQEKSVSRREMDVSRRRLDKSRSKSDSDSDSPSQRKQTGRSQDFQHSASREWQQTGSRERRDGGTDREKGKSRNTERHTYGRDSDFHGDRQKGRSSEYSGGMARKRSRSESDNDDERLKEKKRRDKY